MRLLQIESVDDPFRTDAVATAAALRLLSRGAVMGFLPQEDTRRLDEALLGKVLDGLARQGVGRVTAARGRSTTQTLREALVLALEQSEHSPMPVGEWPSLVDVLGDDLLAELLGVSTTSVRRYSAGSRQTPQVVADRLHVIALVVSDLLGAYNDSGVRRWFHRPRPQLQGASPQQRLGRTWDPDGEPAQQVRALAGALAGAGAT